MKLYIRHLLQIFVLLTILSCTGDVDFDQAKNIELNQNFSSTFVFLNVDQNNFLNTDASTEIATLTDISTIDIFDSEYFQDNLVKTIFNFKIENTFNRDFILELYFLNADNAITNSFSIDVPNNSNITHFESYDGLDLLSLKFSEKLKITIQLQPSLDSSILTNGVGMDLTLKSSANFIFKVN